MRYFRKREFTAQGILISALMGMFAKIEDVSENNKDEFTPIVVFMAFSIEAYLNSIGFRKIEHWDNVERISWKDKVEILHKVNQKEFDWGSEPLQFVSSIFKLRDKLAHGKPEVIREEVQDSSCKSLQASYKGDGYEELFPVWYQSIDREWVLSAKDKFHDVMIYLGKLHDLHESDHLHHSSESFEVEDK